jgi:hypothetical protein
MRKLIRRPSPAMIVALIALFVALGGTGYAVTALPKNSVGEKQLRKAAITSQKIRANAVRSGDIANSTIVGRDLRAGTLGQREIAESKLGTVPRASIADTFAGLTPDQFLARLGLQCPAGTVATYSACFEDSPRPATSWTLAVLTCKNAGRRLPTFADLVAYYGLSKPVPSGGELTGSTGPEGGQNVATVVLDNTGTSVEYIDTAGNAERASRCVTWPTRAP